MTSPPPPEGFEPHSEEFWTVVQQQSNAGHIAWSLEEMVYHSPEPVFASLQQDPAAYARTLARLIGLAWATGLDADNMVLEEERQLAGKAPSAEFQAACDALARWLWGVHRSSGQERH